MASYRIIKYSDIVKHKWQGSDEELLIVLKGLAKFSQLSASQITDVAKLIRDGFEDKQLYNKLNRSQYGAEFKSLFHDYVKAQENYTAPVVPTNGLDDEPLTEDEVVRVWSGIARDAASTSRDRLRATELVAKSLGMFEVKQAATTMMSDAQLFHQVNIMFTDPAFLERVPVQLRSALSQSVEAIQALAADTDTKDTAPLGISPPATSEGQTG